MTFSNPTYWLCTTPRSGSSALGDALAHTGVAGRPTEYFNSRFWPELFERFGVASVPEYLAALVRETASPNGVFGVKVMLDRDSSPLFEGLREDPAYAAALSDAALVQEMFPHLRLVYLTRRNKVRQAVSFWRAQRSGVWERYPRDAEPGTETPIALGPDAHEFNFFTLDRLVGEMTLREARWQDFFDAFKAPPYTPPHTVVYEDYVLEPEKAVRGILEFLGLEPSPGWSLPRLPMERLADEVSDAWVARYLEEKAHTNRALGL